MKAALFRQAPFPAIEFEPATSAERRCAPAASPDLSDVCLVTIDAILARMENRSGSSGTMTKGKHKVERLLRHAGQHAVSALRT